MKFVLLYILVTSAVGFVMMGMDKRKARKNQYRTSEKTLWIVAIIGGAIGSFLGMNYFRHKTKHASFKWGLPFLAIVQIVIFGYILFNL
ncbi:DUF1294 domain-containing protein [Paenisporosarcina cavernae]|uniref:DUF1294 domain-containing protein n=1 Tax=Paenisporosarcina cavernae TaxID=2320858 RepID=A0A385YTG9_9BACL|nr:DUF1294 domain-containing protein [Paenisporosarcina cavernae]AYC29811.1 DUF1294 domain-containing protein [Paenisporosarcina cavernae]